MVNTTVNLTKDEVKSFLDELRTRLLVKTEDETQVKDALSEHPLFVHHQTEIAFIDQIVMECLSDNVKEYLDKTHAADGKLPCDFILAESSQAKNRKLACGTPVWTHGHPFYKALVSNPSDLYKRWSGKDRKKLSVFAAVAPDIALLAPFRVVFECKYFNQPGRHIATSELVSGLYQTFFYRAMPTKPAGAGGLRFGWDYEYACFLAYDATHTQRLRQAWHDLKETRKRFWDDGNIYVMILPRTNAVA
jgi:hypothetical protein